MYLMKLAEQQRYTVIAQLHQKTLKTKEDLQWLGTMSTIMHNLQVNTKSMRKDVDISPQIEDILVILLTANPQYLRQKSITIMSTDADGAALTAIADRLG